MLLIGIDEAGYGPRIGPLCHGYSAIRYAPAAAETAPPDLWELLHPSVMRFPGFDGCTVVDDSKKIHGAPDGKELLARGVRAFLQCLTAAGELCEDSGGDLFVRILPDHDRAKLEEDAWCAPHAHAAAPSESPPAEKSSRRSSRKMAALGAPPDKIPPIAETLKAKQVSVVAVGARGMSAKHYNAALKAGINKADVNWSVIAEQLCALLKLAAPGEAVNVVIDRQGGRKFYAAKLGELFPGFLPWVERETPAASVYRVETGERTVRISFMVDADGQALPVALGSMAAKLARELCMHRLNAYFRSHVPELRPTAGYYGDASRFLRETSRLRKKLGINNAELVRIK